MSLHNYVKSEFLFLKSRSLKIGELFHDHIKLAK